MVCLTPVGRRGREHGDRVVIGLEASLTEETKNVLKRSVDNGYPFDSVPVITVLTVPATPVLVTRPPSSKRDFKPPLTNILETGGM